MSNVKSGLLSLHIAVLLLGGTAQFSKLIPLSALDITLGRAMVGFVCLCVMVCLFKERFLLDSIKCYAIGVLLGLLLSAHWVTYFQSMQMAGVAVGVVALFSYPVMTVFIEPLFSGDKVHWQDILSALTVFLGILIIVPEANVGNDITLGILLGVGSALLFALRNVIQRHHFSQYSGSQAMALQMLVVVMSLLFLTGDEIPQADSSVWLLLLLLGIFFTALPHALFASSLRVLQAKTASLISCLQPLYATILAMLLLAEFPNWQTWLGGTLVVSAAVFETIKTVKKR
jgi:drug/metabolite transporter (DMT)-like permease